ncbi:MAG: DUF1002 domain-containing protein [Peptoniphilaceae bacterium]|nr:DUF1002 domain-containing protein [Peptoniphilaceae bacterium]MDY6085398.1 DUF1002 domain-containing protein [Peptoniphilaceae bacterium]
MKETPRFVMAQRLTAFTLALLLLLMPFGRVARADNLKQPVFAYGQSLTDEQKQETAQWLGVSDSALEMQVNIDEMNGLLHDDYDYYQVYSSVYLEPREKGTGVSVKIVTPKTITEITPSQYENAAITAGATDMTIRVASVKAVDGSGALAGVYKAFSGTTGELPKENVQVAQEELSTTSKISEENKDKEGFSDDLLNAAIAEIKAQIITVKEENDGQINSGQIINIVNNVVNNYNLGDVLTQDQMDALSDLMGKFSQIRLTDEQVENLKALGSRLMESGGKLLENVKSQWDAISPETKQEIGGFFQRIFSAIGDFFNSLFH